MTRWLALAALPLLAGAATPPVPDPDLVKRLAGRTALPPQDCLDQQLSDGPATYNGALLYQQGRRFYVNRFANGGCPWLRQLDAVRIDVLGGRLCRGDFVTPFVPATGIVRPTCVLGAFEPYERPAAKDSKP